MANEQNLKPIKKGELSHEEAVRRGKRGGTKRGENAKKRKLLRECFDALLTDKYESKKGKLSGSEVLAMKMFEKAAKGDTKAFELIRDTIGEKPTENVNMLGDLGLDIKIDYGEDHAES